MATAGDGRTPNQSGGAGGKLRKKPYRRSIPATPYDRPPTSLRNNNPNPSLLTKIVDPASRLISAGANRLFDVFRKRLPSLALPGPPEINEEPQNIPPVAGQNENLATTGISEVEQMLQEKTFTRFEIQRLTALLHSRTTESPSDDAVERERAKPLNSPSSLVRHEASTSGSLKKYGDKRDNLYATISTPIVSPRVGEEIASPAELAKAYMGTRSTNISPLFHSSTSLAKTPTSGATKTANSFRNLENGFVTPRSRGRSAMYNMARTPYPRSPSVYTQKGIGSNYGQSSALTSSQSAFGQERKMALKRRSSVLDDDIGSGGVLRRTRQKANILSQRDKRELGYTAPQQPDINSQKLLLTNGPVENGPGLGSGYGFVPPKSTQTATKILQQLEKLSPKERISGSTKSPTKLTLDMLHGQALRSVEKVDSPKLLSYQHDTQKTEVQHHFKLHENRELTSKGKEKVEENGSKKFPIPCNMFTSVNGDLTVNDNASIVTITDLPSKVPAVSPQKRRAFQMSAPEDTFEIDDDDDDEEVPVNNGHVSSPLVENNKPETSLVSNKHVSADVIETLSLPKPSRTPALVENNKPVFLEVTKGPEQTEFKETENSSSLKTVKFVPSPPSTTTTEPLMVPQSPLQMDKVAPEKESNFFEFGKTAENASPFQFSANGPSEVKPDATSDPKAPKSTSVFGSVAKDNHVKFALPNKEENGNENVNVNGNVNGNGKLDSLFSAVPVAASKSDGFSFGNSTNNTSTPNTTPASNPTTFPSLVSFPPSVANTASFFNNTSPSVTSASTTTTNSSADAASTSFSSSVPAPIFSFGSATPKTTIAETGNNTIATNDKEPKPNTSNLPFASSSFSTTTATTSTTTTGSGLFGFSFPTATSTTTETQANPQAASTAVTQSVPFSFGASSSSSLFGSSTPAFGSSASFDVSSITASSEGKSGNSNSGPGFGSTWPAAQQSSGLGSAFASSPFSFGAASSTPTPATTSPITFGSSFPTAGATNSSFLTAGASNSSFPTAGASNSSFPTAGASNSSFAIQSKPLFGNPTPLFGTTTISPNNNDQMSMEDSMAEDSMQTPSPITSFGQAPAAAPVSSFGQAPVASPGFMFGSATPNQSPANAGAPGFTFGSATPTSTQPPANVGAPGFSFGSATPTPTQPPANAGAPGFSFGSATPTPTQPPANAGAPGFSFGSATPTPTQPTAPFQFGGQPNQTPPQNPFQSSSLEFNGGGSFSLGSVDKSGRRIVKVKNKNRSRK